jgi:uncharacterized protein YkwD
VLVGATSRQAYADGAKADASPPLAWTTVSASPIPVDAASLGDLEREALKRCGPVDAGLQATARWIVERKLRGAPMPELDAIALAQRASGEPHPWSRAWAAKGHALSSVVALQGLQQWLGEGAPDPWRRCGAATGAGPGDARVIAVIAVDALADLAPLPVRARIGQWLTVDARLRAHADGAQVIVLGPSGAPQPLLTSFDGTVVRARFAPDRPGEFAVQVMADLPTGPRPVIEASVFADVDPSLVRTDARAPGEDQDASLTDDAAIASMVRTARASAGLAPLVRDGRLDAIALDHARRMADARQLAHDVGDGDPVDRMSAVGLEPRDAGENVAHARTVARAHRAMWASPSHRANLLRREFAREGLAVARDGQGEAWVVEVFASGLP